MKFIDLDIQFECLEDDFRGITFKLVGIDNHIHTVEWSIRIMKEGTRRIVVDMPFLHIMIIMIHCVVALIMKNLNQFPSENGISDKYSLLTIITRALLADARKYALEFGSYVETFKNNGMIQNSTRIRGIPTIFLSLASYRKLG